MAIVDCVTPAAIFSTMFLQASLLKLNLFKKLSDALPVLSMFDGKGSVSLRVCL